MMYKKISFICAAVISVSGQTQAETLEYIPYIGADYVFNEAKGGDVNPGYNALGLNIGTKYNRYFGTELFYQQSFSDSKKINGVISHTSYRAYGLDIAGYLPLWCDKVNLIGTAGIGEYVFRHKIHGNKRHNNSGWGYRLGGGMIYNFSDDLSLRMLIRYNELEKISTSDRLIEYTAGLRYHFNKD